MLNNDEKITVILKPNKFIEIIHNKKKYNVDFFFDTFRKGLKSKNTLVLINLRKNISIPVKDIYAIYSNGEKIYPLEDIISEIENLTEIKEELKLDIKDLIDLKKTLIEEE